MKSKTICPEEQCTGCATCMNKCPKQCITMQEGTLGHLFPQIYAIQCIHCDLCVKVCPANHPIIGTYPLKVYAGRIKNIDEYKSSTSGGIATALSQYVIEQGGIVYGAACMEEIDIRHIRIEKKEDLQLLKGSKYVQSGIHNTYKNVLIDLKNNLLVLFIGTPCQIAGLKAFLGKEYQSLLLVDLICHGVPSLSFLKQHIQTIIGNKKVKRVVFREDNECILSLIAPDQSILYRSDLWKNRFEDLYYNTFIDGFTTRSSCHTCPYATPKRISDITIGDFWGIDEDFRKEHNHGVFCIFPITLKGEQFIQHISNKLYLHEESIEKAINGNDQLRLPQKANLRIKIFLAIHKVLGIKLSYQLCVLDRIIRQQFHKLKNK